MTNDNYLNAIIAAKGLLSELLEDPDHGELTFKGLDGLEDLIITSPQELEDLISGTVLAIGNGEWMAISHSLEEGRYWQGFRASKIATSAELYIRALKEPNNLTCCHKGL